MCVSGVNRLVNTLLVKGCDIIEILFRIRGGNLGFGVVLLPDMT